MRGSYSIKKVLPALASELNYNELQIQDGGLASHTFAQLITNTNNKNLAEIRRNLLDYCKMDTLAMVKIVEKLNAKRPINGSGSLKNSVINRIIP